MNSKNVIRKRFLAILCALVIISCGVQENGKDHPGKRIAAWLEHYDLEMDDFGPEERFDRLYRVVHDFAVAEDDIYAGMYIYSKDSTQAIDLDSYHLVLEEQDGILYSPGREADMEVALIDFEEGLRKRLLFCGPPCLFEEAEFGPGGKILVAGFIENENGWHPSLWETSYSDAYIGQRVSSQSIPAERIDYIHAIRLPMIRFWFEGNLSKK